VNNAADNYDVYSCAAVDNLSWCLLCRFWDGWDKTWQWSSRSLKERYCVLQCFRCGLERMEFRRFWALHV